MNFQYLGISVIVLGYCGEKVLLRHPKTGKVVWVGMENVK